jgi:hypothetical protein
MNEASLRSAREQVVAQLSDAFAHDVIDVDEFERRITLAHRANSVAEVAQTVSDLAASASLAVAVPVAAPLPMVVNARENDSLLAIFAGVERRGPWTLPRHLQVVAVMGGVILDFREALLSPGVTEIHIVALMGGVQITVPPNLAVEVSGTAVMGGFSHVERTQVQPDPDQPLLRVHGLAIMGGVEVATRLPGESERDAHRRRRRDRRALRRRDEPKLLP